MAAKKNDKPKGSPITSKTLDSKDLVVKTAPNPITSKNQLRLFVEREKEIDGVGMGVLSDGTAYLTGRGLARLCTVSNARIVEMGQNWSIDSTHGMAEGVKKILEAKGLKGEKPYLEVKHRGKIFYAYPDFVCLAVLEYYAFDQPIKEATRNFRILAGKALHDFIYAQVGYDPRDSVPEVWRQFHDRMSLVYNSVPAGYFSIFKEISDMIVHLGQHGLAIDSKFVPDISVGKMWSKHWADNGLNERFGDRLKYEHHYPHYFPQSASNPQEPWCYPEKSLGEFRRWLREDYIGGGKFERYLEGQVSKRALPPSFAQLALAAYTSDDSTG